MNAQLIVKNKVDMLTNVLRADGVFAVTSGAIALLGAKPVAGLIDLDGSAALIILGIVLLGYGADLLFFAAREPANRRIAQAAVVLNILWVIGSYAGLLLGLFPINATGKWVVALIAEVVALFAVLEIVALRRAAR